MEGVGHRFSPPADISGCILHGWFTHPLAWKRLACIFPFQRRGWGPRSAPFDTFWVLSVQSHRCPFLSLSIRNSSGVRQLSHVFSRMLKHEPLAKAHTARQAISNFTMHQLQKLVGAAALACQSCLPMHPTLYASWGLPALFSGGESSGWEEKKPGFCHYLGTLVLFLLSLLLFLALSVSVYALLERDRLLSSLRLRPLS